MKQDQDLAHLGAIADWMDSKFTIPKTSIKFGLDSILGLFPGVGDTAGLLVTAYMIGYAGRYNLPDHVKGKMIMNAGIDWLIGLVPFAGDVFDIGWKANRRNLELLRQHLKAEWDKDVIDAEVIEKKIA